MAEQKNSTATPQSSKPGEKRVNKCCRHYCPCCFTAVCAVCMPLVVCTIGILACCGSCVFGETFGELDEDDEEVSENEDDSATDP